MSPAPMGSGPDRGDNASRQAGAALTVSSTALPAKHEPRGWWRSLFHRPRPRDESHAAGSYAPPPQEVSAIEQFSLAGLQSELQVIADRLAAAEAQLEQSRQAEETALSQHDKAALDEAWAQRDSATSSVDLLRVQRDVIVRALNRRFEPEVQAWRERAEQQLAAWAEDERREVEALTGHLSEVSAIIGRFRKRPAERWSRKERLLLELQGIRRRAAPLDLPEPDLDWSAPAIDFSAVADQLEEILIELPSLSEGKVDGEPAAKD